MLGKLSRVTKTVEVDGEQTPLLIVHWSTLEPNPTEVNPLLAKVGVVIVTEPDTKLQLPVPTAGIFPASVAVTEQID